MKKIYFAAGLLPLLTLAVASCDGNYDERYPDKYKNVVKFQNGDQQALDLYSTETTQVYNFTVQRGGSALKETTVTATIETMTEAEFTAYTEDYGFTYLSQVPTDAYRLGNGTTVDQITFEPAKIYHLDSLYVDVEKVHAFMETLPVTQTPVIPVVLKSDDATVNSDGQYIFLVPSYSEPQIYLGLSGLKEYTLSPSEAKAGKVTVSLPVSLPVTNRWDLGFTLEVSEDLLSKVNTAQGTSYSMMDPSLYTGIVSPSQNYTFNLGATTTNVDIVIDAPNLPYNKVALPIQLTNITGLDIDIDSSADYVVLGYNVSLITSYTTNDPETSEGAIDNLFDGNAGTFFHSNWSGTCTSETHDPTYGSYIQFTFASELQTISFDIQTRSNGNAGAPDVVHLYCSNDATEWTKFAEITDMLSVLTGGGVKAHFGDYTAPEPFKYLRFCVISSKSGSLTEVNSAYWNAAQLSINSED